MFDKTSESRELVDWNVLSDQWLEVMTLEAKTKVCSPLEALNRASTIRCVGLASPLDLFAAHRFLLTLLYWQAGAAGGVDELRESLLKGKLPQAVLEAIEAEAPRFRLFDRQAPFLQDIAMQNTKKQDCKSAGSLFAEFAAGSNVAHFHHGDDKKMRLCVRCATIGMVRIVPWTQFGGRGLSAAVHGAPPIVATAHGDNLAITLGLNLVALSGEAGDPQWFGHFKPTDRNREIPYLEAFTWNPRRVHLREPEPIDFCWRCGQTAVYGVGPIVYDKNDETKKAAPGSDFRWNDPAAFYGATKQYATIKSTKEAKAASGRDLDLLFTEEHAPKSSVVEANPDHRGWRLVIPCTNAANNKSFDHRQIELASFSPDAVRAMLPAAVEAPRPKGMDGWKEPQPDRRTNGPSRFVQTTARLLTYSDWLVLSAAAYREMHDSPAGFDVLSGLYWGLRDKKVARLPSRNAVWLVLKLMAAVPSRARMPGGSASFNPLRHLPKRQLEDPQKNRRTMSPYPASFQRGAQLEAALRAALDTNMRKRKPEPIDWAGLCSGLDQLLD